MIIHPKLYYIPIGIANSMWGHGNLEIVTKVLNNSIMKTNDVYFYFNVGTNRKDRLICKNSLENKGLIFGKNETNFESYLDNLSSYKYAICPPGNGIDSHRIWECLYLNVIPIVLRSPFTELISKDYFCILLNTWDDLDINDLIEKYTLPNTVTTLNLQYIEDTMKSL
jgi:hypothetical protein